MKKLMRIEFVVIILLILGFVGIVGAQNSPKNIELTKEEEKQVGEKFYLFKPYGGTSSSIEIQGNKITGGSFEAGKADTYPLGDQEVPLPEGSKASFDDGKWKIEIPAEGVIDIPKSGGDTPIEYSKKGIEDLLKIRDSKGNIHELKGNLELVSQGGKLSLNGQGWAKLDSMTLVNRGELQANKIYLDFDGKINSNYDDGAYVSYNNKNRVFVTGSNIDKRGPKIKFDKNNPFGIELNDNDHMAISALGKKKGSYVKIENRFGENRIPKMETLNGFALDFDNKGIHYRTKDGKLYLKAKGAIMVGDNGFKTLESSAPIEVISLKGDHKNKYPISTRLSAGDNKLANVLLIGDEPIFSYGAPEYQKTDFHYKDTNLLVGLSNSRLFYNMKSTADFSGFLNGRVGLTKWSGNLDLTQDKMRRMADYIAGLPPSFWERTGFNKENPMIIAGQSMRGTTIGYASKYGRLRDYSGYAHIRLDGNSLSTVIHETGHLFDFYTSDSFNNEWNSVSGQISVTGYGTTGIGGRNPDYSEDIAETYMQVYTGIGNLNAGTYASNHARAKVSLLRKYRFISSGDLKRVGLQENKIGDYINLVRS